jgi:hypothetical protein
MHSDDVATYCNNRNCYFFLHEPTARWLTDHADHLQAKLDIALAALRQIAHDAYDGTIRQQANAALTMIEGHDESTAG